MRPLLLSCVAALVLAYGADAAPPPVLANAALVQRADAVCERYGALLQNPDGRDATLGDSDHDAAWLRLFAGQRRALGALRPNRRDAPAYGRFLASLGSLEQAARGLMSALERGARERPARNALRRFVVAHAASTRLARTVGMRRCPGA